ncbi:hypothetical protein FJZ36_17235 [Candidatus Poribacteria bacterium]|nr:hypothetical protein [Candidatus Poribacteria bacterium]
MRLRVLIPLVLLIPINSVWMMRASLWNAGYPTTVSLYYNCILYLFVLVVANGLASRLSPRRALSPRDITTIYAGIAVASAINGLDMLQLIGSLVAGPHALATPENDWLGLFGKYLPAWGIVADRGALTHYVAGESTFYMMAHIRAWLSPVLAWSAFTICLCLMMLGMTLLLNARWVAHERLSFPVIQLPLAMVEGSLFRAPVMWVGFAVGAIMATMNGLHFFYPMIPTVGRPIDLSRLFTEKPLNAIDWLPVAAHPFAVGLGFLIPLELSFSCWFFYFFWKLERVAAAASGIRATGFPFIDEQTTGAYIAFGAVSLWSARHEVKRALRFRSSDRDGDGSARMGAVALVLGTVGVGIFSARAGLLPVAFLLFFGFYALLSVAIGRLRAELGAPVHDLHFAGPERMMVSVLGSRFANPREMTVLSMFWFFNRAYRSHPMPTILEGYKLADRVDSDSRRHTTAIVVAIVLGTLAGFWGHLHSAYRFGTSTRFWPANEAYGRLARWLDTPTGFDPSMAGAYGVGALVVILLSVARTRFLSFPFHPVGFVVSSSWGMNPFWFSIFISWAIKSMLLRTGGIGLYRRVVPLFLGAILGEFLADAGFGIAGTLLRVPTYLWYG